MNQPADGFGFNLSSKSDLSDFDNQNTQLGYNQWFLGTHIEDVSPAELQKRAAAFSKKQGKAA